MLRLAILLYVLIGATLAGCAVVAVLVAGQGTTLPIVYAAVAGFVLGMPVSYAVAKALY